VFYVYVNEGAARPQIILTVSEKGGGLIGCPRPGAKAGIVKSL